MTRMHHPAFDLRSGARIYRAMPLRFIRAQPIVVPEGINQTQGWFYTLLILSTHLFGTASWKSCLMVTSLQSYPQTRSSYPPRLPNRSHLHCQSLHLRHPHRGFDQGQSSRIHPSHKQQCRLPSFKES
ncbi:hypothetical protein EDB19DRAFT_122851 [Suillus lakei]|nr:hypothetical protein EDB19DRAFT_122851 [Suillus lakei]